MLHRSNAAEPTVRRHLAAVAAGDPLLMAADYAADALLTRAGREYAGRAAIAAYFATVSTRLAGGRVEQVLLCVDGERATVRWRIVGGPADGVCGTDRYEVRRGHIARQTVQLDGGDF